MAPEGHADVRLARPMNSRSRMGVTIRPDIHERLSRILARLSSEPPTHERLRPLRPARRQPNAKLSLRRAVALRRLYAKGATLDALARRFHIAISTAWRAVRGETWRS